MPRLAMFGLYENPTRKSVRHVRTLALESLFVMCEQERMSTAPLKSIADLRADLKLTLEDFGARVGLKSKGQVSQIERANRCSPEVALEIEKLSERRLDAGILNPTIAAARNSVSA